MSLCVFGRFAVLMTAALWVTSAYSQDTNSASPPAGPPAPAQKADGGATPLPTLEVEASKQPKAKKTVKAKKTAPQQAAAPAPAPQPTPATEPGLTSPPGSFVATTSIAATKTDTPILEVPQSISVVTKEQMDTRGVSTVVEALQYTAGVSTHTGGKDPRFDWFKVRGFDAKDYGVFRDGLKEMSSANYFTTFRNETYGLERIDVIKGPSSVLYGQTPPGGLINLVTKRPTRETIREVYGEIGTDDRFQGAFDLGGSVDPSGTLMFRLTGLARDADAQVANFSDFVKDDRLFIAPAFTWKPDDNTTLTVLTDFQHDNTGNAFAASRFYPTLPLSPAVTVTNSEPTKFFTGDPNYDKFEQNQFRIGYQFEHRFNSDLKVRQSARYGEVDLDYRYMLGGIIADNPTELRTPRAFDTSSDMFAIDNQIEGRLGTGPVAHTVVAGLDHQRLSIDEVGYTAPFFPGYPLDLNNPVYGIDIPKPTTVGTSTTQDAKQTGLYLQDQAKLGSWILTLGGRYDWATVDTYDRLAVKRTESEDEAFSGRAGLTYMVTPDLATYGSYSESFLPTLGTDAAGKPFDPTTGQQYEAGVKYELGKQLRLTFAAFDITQQNVLTVDSTQSGTCAPACQTQTGEVRSRGVELEAVATLTEGLSLIASYTAMDIEITKSKRATELGNVPTATPEEMASIFADYTFQSGPLAGFGFGAGARYIGESYQDGPNLYVNDAYTVIDAALHYTTGGTMFAVNASNLFDKEEASCTASGGCQWISPRIVNASVRYRW